MLQVIRRTCIVALGSVCMVVLPVIASPAHAGVAKTVRVTGISAVYNGDVAAAFEAAKKSALRLAVEEGVGVLVSGRTRVANFAVIDDDILSVTRGHVQSFEVVNQGSSSDGMYEVEIEAKVDLGQLYNQLSALDLLLEESGSPRLVCVGGEYVLSDAGSSSVQWGTLCGELESRLESLGMGLFQVDGLHYEGESLPDNRSPVTAVPAVKAGEPAEILIVAMANLQANQGLSVPFSGNGLKDVGIQSVVAEISARAQWSDTGETLASTRATGRGAGTTFRTAATSAIADVSPRVAQQLGAELVEELRSRLYDGRLIELEVATENALQLQTFETEVSEHVNAIERLYPRTRTQLDGSYHASYQARSKGTAFDLAREVAVEGIPEMDVDIVRVTLNSMTLRLSE